MKALRPIGHEDRLSVVDHLDELRTRLFVCVGVLVVVFCVCFWQNHALIAALNRALPSEASVAAHNGLAAEPKQVASEQHAFRRIEAGASELARAAAHAKGVPPGVDRGARTIASGAAEAARVLPKKTSQQEKPVTLGPGESFTTTLMVVGYFSLLISLPVILYELFAFVIPALTSTERRAAIPVMVLAPFLFACGAVFTYFEVLPPALHFLQGYNNSEFQVLVQAGSLYKFEMLLMIGIGLAFQVPLVLLGLQRLGMIDAGTLTGNWRYAVLIIAVVVAALPGVDPVTMFFETLPLFVLYLASIVMVKIADRRSARSEAAAASLDTGLDVS